MSINKEVRIGLLATISVVIFFVGFYFLKGAKLFSDSATYYCFYEDVGGLMTSANVQVQGLNVGHVTQMKLLGTNKIRVSIELGKDIHLPKGTSASINANDFLGGKVLKLALGTGPGMMKPGDTLLHSNEQSIADRISAEVSPRLLELKTTLNNINAITDADNQREIAAAMKSINIATKHLAEISAAMAKETGQVATIMNNTSKMTANLVQETDSLKRILSNVSTVTRTLAGAPIEKTLADLQHTTAQLQGVIDKINNNKGTLGMLVNDKEVYNNLNKSLISINNLTDDLKNHPGRYVNFSVFGKKNK